MKKTVLFEEHLKLGAKMTPFAGYEMPLSYSSLQEEHLAVRSKAGVFDVSHMGEFIVKGKEALQFVQSVSSNDASQLEIGQAQYSCLPNEEGGIVDDLLVYRLTEENCSAGEQAFMLVVNAANIEKDFQWIEKYLQYDCRLINISNECGLIAIQGPQVAGMIQEFCDQNLNEIPYYHFIKTRFADRDNILVSNTGYTGAGGFELYGNNADILFIWQKLFSRYSPEELIPCGLGARDTLRLEMGYCLYGQDIDDTTSPVEAGLSWITKTNKAENFPSKEIFQKQKKGGIKRKLCALMLNDRRVPRPGYVIQNKAGNEIGKVTSGTFSPSLQKPIGLGYVNIPENETGNIIFIQANKKLLQGEVIKPPFIKN